MHKITLWGASALTGIMFMAAPFSAGAVSLQDLQNQVASLLKQISQLQSQAQTGATISNSSSDQTSIAQHRVCKILNRNLTAGSRGDDVQGLQEFLQSQGYLSANPTGYFGTLTREAVAKWQTAEGVSAAGVFGPLSRERLKFRCGGVGNTNQQFSASPQTGSAPLTVTFNTWLSGFRINTISYSIDYGDGSSERAADCLAPADACISPGQNTHTYTSNGTYTATLNKITDPCAGQVACRAAIHSEVIGKLEITVGPIACTKEYKPVCGGKQVVCIKAPCNPVPTTYGNVCMMKADNALYLYEGQCKDPSVTPESDAQCKSWYDGCNSCGRSTPGGPAFCTLKYCAPESTGPAYCSAYFDSNTNKPPTISGFSGPTTLAVNSSGTWTINASDPDNQSLSYHILWGDESAYPMITNGAALSDSFVQTTTFTHAYTSVGTYTITIVVKDASGQAAQTTTTVKVGSDPIACTMEYAPVCGQPKWSCPSGMFCATVMPAPQTYGNRCTLNASGATFLYSGECSTGVYY